MRAVPVSGGNSRRRAREITRHMRFHPVDRTRAAPFRHRRLGVLIPLSYAVSANVHKAAAFTALFRPHANGTKKPVSCAASWPP